MDTANARLLKLANVLLWVALTLIAVGFVLALIDNDTAPETIDLGPGCRIYEDGSATCQDEQGGWHFPADTFEWDCETMGNLTCGPNPSR